MLTSHWNFTSSLMTVTVSSLLHKFELNWLYWVENYVSPHHRLYINHHLTRLSREVVRCQMSSGPRGVVKWGECCPWLYCIEFNWIWWWFDVMVLAPLHHMTQFTPYRPYFRPHGQSELTRCRRFSCGPQKIWLTPCRRFSCRHYFFDTLQTFFPHLHGCFEHTSAQVSAIFRTDFILKAVHTI